MQFIPENIDMAELAGVLQTVFASEPPRGYLIGRTQLRDAVARRLECSELQAEEVVDTMVSLGYLKYEGPSGTEVDPLFCWWIDARPR
jgi:hypothetical protein